MEPYLAKIEWKIIISKGVKIVILNFDIEIWWIAIIDCLYLQQLKPYEHEQQHLPIQNQLSINHSWQQRQQHCSHHHRSADPPTYLFY